jgi:hypothetical protein
MADELPVEEVSDDLFHVPRLSAKGKAATPEGPAFTAPSLPPDPEGRVVGAAGFTPAGASRKANRAQARAGKQAEAEAAKRRRRERREAADREQQARKSTEYLPPHGEAGRRSGWSPTRLKIAPHHATSEVLSAAYPFLAEAGLGSEGVLIGADLWSGAAFCFDPWVLYQRGYITNPNALLAGVIGRGKSTLAKSLAVRSIAFGRRVYVPGDPKGEWTSVSKAVGGAAIELGGGNRLNPLDPGPLRRDLEGRSPEQVIRQRRLDLLGSLVAQALGRPMMAVEHTAVSAALDATVGEADERDQVPTLPMVVDALLNPPAAGFGSTIDQLREDGRHVGHALGRLVYGDLAGLFDGPSTVAFEPTLPMVSLDLSRISGSDTMIALVMTCASAWMDAALSDPEAGQRWVVYDEAWRLIANPALLARMQSQWKLSRALGIANLMVIHRLSDLDGVGDAGSGARNLALGLLGDCSTKIIYAQERGEAEKTGAQIGLTSTEIRELPDLSRGEGLWRIGERAFLLRHLCTPGELHLFDTNARMTTVPHGFTRTEGS